MKAIEINGLTKQYGSYKAVNDLCFDVDSKEMIGFLGVNGAGKSTTINMLSTILRPDSGEVFVNGNKLGRDDRRIRESIGVVYQQNVLDELLTVRENIFVRARLAGMENSDIKRRICELCELLSLDDILNKKYKVLSGGQKRRCEIAAALMHAPGILFLDEPTTGLDPATRLEVWNAVKSLRQNKDMTVFLTTHYMEEAAAADKIVIIDKGVKKAEGTPFELKEKYARDKLKLFFDKDKEPQIIQLLENREFIEEAFGLEVLIKDSFEAIGLVEKLKGRINGFEVIQGNLDDVFLNVTKE